MLKVEWLQAVQDKVSVPFSGISISGQVTSNAGHRLALGSQEGQGSSVTPVEAVAVARGTGVAPTR